jgi:hypothetical protein
MVNYRLADVGSNPYIECLPDGGQIENERDALDLVAACGEYRADRLLIHAENLTEDFFNLKTGLAGAVLLKFSNYAIRVALLLAPEAISGRFGEMAMEANRVNRAFHVFFEHEAAETWLAKD